jgi:hypothetical protein
MSKLSNTSRELRHAGRELRDLRISRADDRPAGRRLLLPALLGTAAGALAAWLFDPERGRGRRAQLADQAGAAGRRGLRLVDRQRRMLTSLATGKLAALRAHRAQDAHVDDATLKERVESELLRGLETPKGAININAEQGIVVLRGEVPDDGLRETLEQRAADVPGVWSVHNLLHLPGEPAPTQR